MRWPSASAVPWMFPCRSNSFSDIMCRFFTRRACELPRNMKEETASLVFAAWLAPVLASIPKRLAFPTTVLAKSFVQMSPPNWVADGAFSLVENLLNAALITNCRGWLNGGSYDVDCAQEPMISCRISRRLGLRVKECSMELSSIPGPPQLLQMGRGSGKHFASTCHIALVMSPRGVDIFTLFQEMPQGTDLTCAAIFSATHRNSLAQQRSQNIRLVFALLAKLWSAALDLPKASTRGTAGSSGISTLPSWRLRSLKSVENRRLRRQLNGAAGRKLSVSLSLFWVVFENNLEISSTS